MITAPGSRRSRPAATWHLGATAAVVSVVAALLPLGAPWALAVMYSLLLVAAGADWALAEAPGRIAVRRSLPPSLSVGEPAEVVWEVTNPGRRSLRVAIADELAGSLQATSRRAHLSIGPGATAAVSAGICPTRRGDFRPTEVMVRSHGPFGLVGRQATRRQQDVLRVFPAFRSRQAAELSIKQARLLEVGLRSARSGGAGTEFELLRDYSVDDDSRRIDWLATARTGRPIVRTFRTERNQSVIVLLDNGRTMAGQVAGVPRIEHAMDAAMMLVTVATRLGDRAGLVAFDRRVRAIVPPSAGRAQFARVVDAMYRLEPELAESDYRGAFTETLARFRRRALLVVLTELADEAVQENLLNDLPLLAQRHLVLIGAVRDPAVAQWAESEPTEAGTSYRKAAAIAAVAQRRRVVGVLASMGATMVDAVPGELAPRLADTYLRAKATGRL